MVKQWSDGTVYKTVIQTMSAFYHEQKEAKSFLPPRQTSFEYPLTAIMC